MTVRQDESPRLIAHRRYLASLNPNIERPVIVPMEIAYTCPVAIPTQGDDVSPAPYHVPSDKDFFLTGLTGFVEMVPTPAPGTVEDPIVRCADLIQVQITSNGDKEEMFDTPITMSQIVPSHRRVKPPIKLPSIWRVPADDDIMVEFTVLPAWTGLMAPATIRRFGIALIGILIRQVDLLEYGRLDGKG